MQLEALFWLCPDATEAVIQLGMTPDQAAIRRKTMLAVARDDGWLDMDRLAALRIVNSAAVTICPLCLVPVPAIAFLSRIEQAAGRETLDQTVTEISLFHIQELRVGRLQHKPYNLGWGHHHCNVVTKDSGITKTIEWMRSVLERNK